jgi:hypothetical protein
MYSKAQMDRRLLVLALRMFALGTDSFVVAVILPEISRTFHVTIGAAGQMTTAYAITKPLWRASIVAVSLGIAELASWRIQTANTTRQADLRSTPKIIANVRA